MAQSTTALTIVASFAFACCLLLLGHQLRVKLKLLRDIYLPGSLIGGVVGLGLVQLAALNDTVNEFTQEGCWLQRCTVRVLNHYFRASRRLGRASKFPHHNCVCMLVSGRRDTTSTGGLGNEWSAVDVWTNCSVGTGIICSTSIILIHSLSTLYQRSQLQCFLNLCLELVM